MSLLVIYRLFIRHNDNFLNSKLESLAVQYTKNNFEHLSILIHFLLIS